MKEIGVFEAKNKFDTLLDWVESGEEVLITRHGKAVARMISAAPGIDRAKTRQAAVNIAARRIGVKLEGLKIKNLINEGRR